MELKWFNLKNLRVLYDIYASIVYPFFRILLFFLGREVTKHAEDAQDNS